MTLCQQDKARVPLGGGSVSQQRWTGEGVVWSPPAPLCESFGGSESDMVASSR